MRRNLIFLLLLCVGYLPVLAQDLSEEEVKKLMTDAFRYDGSIHDGTVMFCSHLARTLCPPADLYARELKTNGYILANDGLVWEG